MGAGCSFSLDDAPRPQRADLPTRPTYGACVLVGPPVFEATHIGPVDTLFGQSHDFAQSLCDLNGRLNGLLLDVKLASGLLQGGFDTLVVPSPNVDVFSVELLTAHGLPIDAAQASQLRSRSECTLSGCDKRLALCIDRLSDFFVRNAGRRDTGLALSAAGTLEPRAAEQELDPEVQAFNGAFTDMRAALGGDYLLALHLHKAQARGVPAFRLRLLKPAAAPPHAAPEDFPAAPHTAAACAAAPFTPGAQPSLSAQPQPVPGSAPPTPQLLQRTPQPYAAPHAHVEAEAPAGWCRWEPVGPLDQAACPNASALHDAVHAFHDANGRLAAALRDAGLTAFGAIVLASNRTVRLANGGASTASPTASYPIAPASGPDPVPAVRALPAAALGAVSRAVDALNAALHRLGGAAAAAAGSGSGGAACFAALLTHVLGELREVVAAAGGDAALEAYHPSVHFSRGPDLSLCFSLDPYLEVLSQLGGAGRDGVAGADAREAGGVCGGGAWQRVPPFPDCLSAPVRRGWLLLQSLLEAHNGAVRQLAQLGRVAAAFEDGMRGRMRTVAEDAAAARLPLRAASAAARALARNHAEFKACCQGSLQALEATARLVCDELGEAAQLASVQCGFMNPMSWSVSIASTMSTATALPLAGSVASTPSRAAADSLAGGALLSSDPAAGGDAASDVPVPIAAAGAWGAASAPTTPERVESRRYGGGATATPVPGSPPDAGCRPGQPQRSPQPLDLSAGSLAGSGSFWGPSGLVAKPVQRTVSCGISRGADGIGDDVRTELLRCRDAFGLSGLRGEQSFGGWLPLDGGGALDAITAGAGQGERAARDPSPAAAERHGSRRVAGVAATAEGGAAARSALPALPASTGGGPRAGESLAEEYARAALAYLQLHQAG